MPRAEESVHASHSALALCREALPDESPIDGDTSVRGHVHADAVHPRIEGSPGHLYTGVHEHGERAPLYALGGPQTHLGNSSGRLYDRPARLAQRDGRGLGAG